MGERGTKRLITVFAEAMSRVASRASKDCLAMLCDTKADGAMKNPISLVSSLNRHTFGHSVLKYAKLKVNVISHSPPFTTFYVENGLFSFIRQPKFDYSLLAFFVSFNFVVCKL